MRVITTRASAFGYNNAYNKDFRGLNEFDLNAAATFEIVRRDIEDGMGICLIPNYQERQQLLGLFKLIQDLGIDGVNTAITYGLDKLLYSSMKDHIKTKIENGRD